MYFNSIDDYITATAVRSNTNIWAGGKLLTYVLPLNQVKFYRPTVVELGFAFIITIIVYTYSTYTHLYSLMFFTSLVASSVDDVHMDTVASRIRVHLRGTR